jgi:hypothetical protein
VGTRRYAVLDPVPGGGARGERERIVSYRPAGRGGGMDGGEAAAPLLLATRTKRARREGCPGCRLEEANEANAGIPYRNFFYIWIVCLTSSEYQPCRRSHTDNPPFFNFSAIWILVCAASFDWGIFYSSSSLVGDVPPRTRRSSR